MAQTPPKVGTNAFWENYYSQDRNRPSAVMSGLASAADAATFGLLPTLYSVATGTDAAQNAKKFEAYQRANTAADWIGGTLGTLAYIPAGGAALRGLGLLGKGARAALSAAAPAAEAVVPRAARLLGAETAYTGAPVSGVIGPQLSRVAVGRTALNSAKRAGALAALPAGLSVFGVSREDAPAQATQAAEVASTPARQMYQNGEPVMAGPAGSVATSPQSDERQMWANQLGLTRDQVLGIEQKYGGIPLSMAKALVDLQPKAASYKERAFNTLDGIMQAQTQQFMATNPTPQAMAAWQDYLRKTYSNMLYKPGALDDLTMSQVDQGQE